MHLPVVRCLTSFKFSQEPPIEHLGGESVKFPKSRLWNYLVTCLLGILQFQTYGTLQLTQRSVLQWSSVLARYPGTPLQRCKPGLLCISLLGQELVHCFYLHGVSKLDQEEVMGQGGEEKKGYKIFSLLFPPCLIFLHDPSISPHNMATFLSYSLIFLLSLIHLSVHQNVVPQAGQSESNYFIPSPQSG